MKPLNSDEGFQLLISIQEVIKSHLDRIDFNAGVEESQELHSLSEQLALTQQENSNGSDEFLNDIAIVRTYVEFFRSYGRLWDQISNGHYSESWRTLQDANDSLRLIRRWSGLKLDPLVEQLFALESLYPYKIFASAGWIVEWYECSICGNDIDSFECVHRTNELYRGQRACAIARNIRDMDHIAFVKYPVDKRCVVAIQDDAPGFSGIAFLANALSRTDFKASNFGGVIWGKRKVANSEFVKVGRNDLCNCRSGKKFKRCCSDKEFIEIDHAEIVPMRSIYEGSGILT
jgi:hypothetical protein